MMYNSKRRKGEDKEGTSWDKKIEMSKGHY